MKTKFRLTGFLIVLGLILSSLVLAVHDQVSAQEPPAAVSNEAQSGISPGNLSTPQLIEAALAKGEIDQETANLYLAYAFGAYDKLPERYRSQVPWSGTLPLRRLQEAVKTMKVSPKRAEIVEILSGDCSDSTGALPNIVNTTHFHVEHGAIGGALDINVYTTSVESAWTTEIDTFGWAAPPVLSGNPPPGNRYHVRIAPLGGGLYGFVSTGGAHAGFVGDNPNTAWNDGDAFASCMVLNNDFTGFPGSPQQALDATTAHEFNHSIQFGYGGLTGGNQPDDNFVEGGATWMEDEVFDAANDNYNYLWPQFTMCMGEYTESPYPYWITFRGLTERFGTGTASAGEQVMQDFWEATSQNTGDNLSALNTALVNKGTNLADAYHAYAVAVKFNKACGGGYVYPYCFEEGADYVTSAGPTPLTGNITAVGSNYNGSIADNYALNWISLPATGSPYTVTLQNTSGGGQLRGSVVCDTGTALNVNALASVVGAGSSSSLTNFNPAGCTSVVAVVTNQAQTAANPASCLARTYQLRTSRTGAPPASINLYLPIILKSDPPVAPSNIINGTFESGPGVGWSEFSTHGYPLILTIGDFPGTIIPLSGSWAVWLGGDDNELSALRQQVTVPAATPYLAYWHWIASQDACGYDWGGVIINNSDVVDVYELCDVQDTFGWVKRVVNLSIYAGQSVLLDIRAENDFSLNSNLFIDDVSFQATATRTDIAGPTVDLEVDAAGPKLEQLLTGRVERTGLENLLGSPESTASKPVKAEK